MRIFVESEAGSDLRRVYDETTFALVSMRRVAAPYPFPYGFIVGTTNEDGSAVDCFVLTERPIRTGTLVDGDPVGLVEQIENGEVDHKVLAIIPGEDAPPPANIEETLRSFIAALFRPFPNARVDVGRILGADEAKAFVASRRADATEGGER